MVQVSSELEGLIRNACGLGILASWQSIDVPDEKLCTRQVPLVVASCFRTTTSSSITELGFPYQIKQALSNTALDTHIRERCLQVLRDTEPVTSGRR
jgi:hypothetical protein